MNETPIRPDALVSANTQRRQKVASIWTPRINAYLIENADGFERSGYMTYSHIDLDYQTAKDIASVYNMYGWRVEATDDQRDGVYMTFKKAITSTPWDR